MNPLQWIGAWGYYKDEATGLYYVRARIYQPTSGRWWSVDPLGFVDGMNLYRAYFVPTLVDPSGLRIIIAGPSQGLVDALAEFLYPQYPSESVTFFFNSGHPVVKHARNSARIKWIFDYYNKDLDSYCDCPRTAPYTSSIEAKFTAKLKEFWEDLGSGWGMRRPGLEGDYGIDILGSFSLFVSVGIDCKTGCKFMNWSIYNVFSIQSLLRNPLTRTPLVNPSNSRTVTTWINGSESSCS